MTSGWSQLIELSEGKWSSGRDHFPLALERELLKGCDLSGKRCLDVETEDGLIAALLARQGARVTAAGRDSSPAHVAQVVKKLGVDIDYLGPRGLTELKELTLNQGRDPFSLVFQTGSKHEFLRHPNPVGLLATLRSLACEGGLVLFETTASVATGIGLHQIQTWEGNAFQMWMPTLDCLDYLIRFVRMAPIDCLHTHPRLHADRGGVAIRVAILCRVVREHVREPGDDWIDLLNFRDVLIDYGLDLDAADASGAWQPLAYESSNPNLVQRDGGEAIDVHRSVMASKPFPAAATSMGRLALSDVS